MNFGAVPTLTLKQRLTLKLSGRVFLRYVKPEGYRDYVALYAVKCSRHGVYLDNPHGYDDSFQCNACLAEAKEEAEL